MELVEITKNAELISQKISLHVKDVSVVTELSAFETAVNIVLFVNHIEAFYKKIIKLETGKNLKQIEMLDAMLDYGISEEFKEAYSSIKALRNGVVHNISFADLVVGYFVCGIRGLV